MAAVPPSSQLQPQPQSQPHANGTSQQYAPKAASGDLLDLMGNMALEAEPSSAPSTSPSDLLALEAPPAATPPAPPADPADSLALALLDGGPTQVQVLISEPNCFINHLPNAAFVLFQLDICLNQCLVCILYRNMYAIFMF